MMARTHIARAAAVMVGVALLAGCAHAPSPAGRDTKVEPVPAAVQRAPVPNLASAAGPDSAQVVAMLKGVRNAACPLPGVATGGQPDSLQLQALAHSGYRAVLDLRSAGEPRGMDEDAAARAAGLAYHQLPVTAETLNDSTFDAFRALAAEPGNHPMLVHCASGNRVGAVMIPWLVLDRGWGIERAVTTANAGGLTSTELRDRALDYVARHTPAGK